MRVYQVYFRDGINVKKVVCYSKIAGLMYLLLFALSLIVGFLPFVLFKNQDEGVFKVIWIVLISLCSVFSVFGFLHHSQYLYIEGDKLILKNLLFTIKVLDIVECYYEVTNLESYYGRIYIPKKWICIYSIDETKKFEYGFSNGRKFKRIQLIYNKSNLEFVSSCIKNQQRITYYYIKNDF